MAAPDTSPTRSGVDELTTDATFFSEHLGWPVTVDVDHERLVVATGGALDAFRIPRTLAEHVASELSTSLMSGPVSKDDSDRWWTFITAACQRPSRELPHELRSAGIYAVPVGGELVIPPISKHTSWRHKPRPDQALPPYSTVIAVARQVITRGS